MFPLMPARKHPANKKAQILLIEKGLTMAEIARKLGVTRATVSRTLHGVRKTKKLRERIAKLLGVHLMDIFTD